MVAELSEEEKIVVMALTHIKDPSLTRAYKCVALWPKPYTQSAFHQVSPTPAPNLTAAKLMAMGIASSLDYDSSSDKEGMHMMLSV